MTTTVPVDLDPVSRPPAAVRLRDLTEARWAAIAVALFAAGAATQLAGAPPALWWALYLACYAAGGWGPALDGLRALRAGSLDVDLLMVVAAAGAAGIGQVFEGALLIVIFATSGALERFATQRTEAAVRGLLDLTPDRVTRVAGDSEQSVDPADLAVGDTVLVRPGDRVGADGRVLAGASEVDQATITGEPLPAPKHQGDEVFAGTVNGTGVLRIRVERPAGDTVLARIVAMVQEASATKARTQLVIEKVEQRYSVGVVLTTLAIFAVPLLAGAEVEPTLLRAMTFMIVASPCAVVLATMPPLLAAIATADRHGVLVKSAVVLERLALRLALGKIVPSKIRSEVMLRDGSPSAWRSTAATRSRRSATAAAATSSVPSSRRPGEHAAHRAGHRLGHQPGHPARPRAMYSTSAAVMGSAPGSSPACHCAGSAGDDRDAARPGVAARQRGRALRRGLMVGAGGDTHGEGQYRGWLEEAGYGSVQVRTAGERPNSLAFATP